MKRSSRLFLHDLKESKKDETKLATLCHICLLNVNYSCDLGHIKLTVWTTNYSLTKMKTQLKATVPLNVWWVKLIPRTNNWIKYSRKTQRNIPQNIQRNIQWNNFCIHASGDILYSGNFGFRVFKHQFTLIKNMFAFAHVALSMVDHPHFPAFLSAIQRCLPNIILRKTCPTKSNADYVQTVEEHLLQK